MDQEAPMQNIQQRAKYQKWLKQETKQEKAVRDGLSEVARISQETEVWSH